MFFTREDLKKIEDWLIKRSKKDTDFEKASPLKGGEELVIIQDGKNKRISIRELLGQLLDLQQLAYSFPFTLGG